MCASMPLFPLGEVRVMRSQTIPFSFFFLRADTLIFILRRKIFATTPDAAMSVIA